MDNNIATVTTVQQFMALVELLRESKTGALDIEDTGAMEGPLLLVSTAITVDGIHAYVLPAGNHDGAPWEGPPLEQYQIDAMRRALQSMPWIMHNGYHDRLRMRTFGLDLQLKHDTMAMAYLLNQSDPKAKTSRKGLEHLAQTILGEDAYKDVDYKNILTEDWDKIATMNGRDALYTFRLYRPLADKLNQNTQLSRIYQWLLMPAVNALIEVTENGVPVDQDKLRTLTSQVTGEQAELLSWLQANTPDPDPEQYPKGWPKHKTLGKGFNPGSTTQVAHILYDIQGRPVMVLTDKGAPSTAADALLQLALLGADEWLDKLLAYRKACTALNSFLLKWPLMWDEQGWLHPKYKPLHVVTGRLSSELPNIQNIPHDSRFRDCFGGVPGYAWVSADYSQIELRIAAWLANEPTMLEAYEKGEDLHRLTARLVLGSASDEARYAAKTLNFGLLYGAGPATLQRIARQDYGLNFSLVEAKQHRANFFMAYPALVSWHEEMKASIQTSRVAVSPIGRIRQLPDAKFWNFKDDELRKKAMAAVREGTNHPVQGFASDLLLGALLRVQPVVKQYEAKIICEVHDEMDFLVPDANVLDFSTMVKYIMEDTSWLSRYGIKLGVPVVATVSAGSHWGSTKEIV